MSGERDRLGNINLTCVPVCQSAPSPRLTRCYGTIVAYTSDARPSGKKSCSDRRLVARASVFWSLEIKQPVPAALSHVGDQNKWRLPGFVRGRYRLTPRPAPCAYPLQPRRALSLGHRRRLPGRKAPRLLLRACLRHAMERHERLPLPSGLVRVWNVVSPTAPIKMVDGLP